MPVSDIRSEILDALGSFAGQPLAAAASAFFKTLGYSSQRKLAIHSLIELQELLDPNGSLTEETAFLSRWRSVHLLFQLSEAEIKAGTAGQLDLSIPAPWEAKDVRSYVFFALDLAPRHDGTAPNRTELSQITRALNRLVPMPVLVLFRHGGTVSLAIINRRKNMKDGTRDVLTRVSLIRDIACAQPHRAHLDLLRRFSLHSLREESGAIRTFADLDNAWQKLLSTQELNKRFYRELVDWFTWTKTEIKLARLPDHTEDNARNRDIATQQFTVRLICRTLFAWFLKEMRLVPPELLELYDAADHRRVLTAGNYDPKGNHYYRGILQNIFFQALNRPMDQRRKSGPEAASDRTVTKSELKKLAYLGKNQLPETFDYDLFDRIPYLNGGLFDALPEDNASDTIEDGALRIPNKLFYAKREDGFTITVGTARRAQQRPVEGLNRIFDRYRFTVAENTPLEEDVALDPELLGHVFENLLAEIDPDDEAAAESARKASGSYYTPRRIVDYMVNEALHLHLRTEFEKKDATRDDLRLLSRLCYELPDDADFSAIADRVVDALEAVRILDPACGSGAFPMGMLHRMVDLLDRVDKDNQRWLQRMLARVPMLARDAFAQQLAGKSHNYLRKLGLIQKNLYGLDIQPLAALIAKLRFFLTLVIEQEVHPTDRAHNYGLQSLPNLETNLLCANSLNDAKHDLLSGPVLRELREAREEYYQPQTSRERRQQLAEVIGGQLATLFPGFAQQTKGIVPANAAMRYVQDSQWLAEWFKHATVAAPFFNVETFFPELVGESVEGAASPSSPAAQGQAAPATSSPFHIVIGNPPYGGTDIAKEVQLALGLGWRDPYGAFIARFLGSPQRPSPLAEDGVLAYIVSDTFMTIKTHQLLREQMLAHRVHKMIRVAGDTFKAVVNCAVILCQRGAAQAEHTCQMADLTNVSIHDQYERFLHLLYQTEGTGQMSRRQNVANQTYALYHYRQSLISTNSNLPFFVASPKLFALMNDTTAPVRHESIAGSRVPVRTVQFNGSEVRLVKLADIADVKVGLQTGDNRAYLYQNPAAHGSYNSIEDYSDFLLTEADLERIRSDGKLRAEVTQRGITKDDKKSPRYFSGRYIVPYDKGGESDSDEGWMPNYWVPTDYFIDWSEWAVNRMKTLTLREKNRAYGKPGGNDKLTSRLQNTQFYFQRGITFSYTGFYAPNFRSSSGAVFDVGGSSCFDFGFRTEELLPLLANKVVRYAAKNFIDQTVNFQVDEFKELPVVIAENSRVQTLAQLTAAIIAQQKKIARYDYASNEQVEIDRLVYAAYGLNETDIREVEDWYARRYPKLASAQRRALAAKQGKTEEDLQARPVLHLYCDESRHLPHDREPFMLLGLVSCPAERARDHNAALTMLWKAHGIPQHFEAKWTKVSPARLDFYRAILEWFLNQKDVDFRCLILPDKQKIFARVPDAKRDEIYYSLYYELLKNTISPGNGYRAFLDIKDTRGREKIKELGNILAMNYPSLAPEERPKLQHVHSDEIRLLQITDLLLGAVGFAHRPRTPQDSPAKLALVAWLEEKLEQKLTGSSSLGAAKVVIETLDGRLL